MSSSIIPSYEEFLDKYSKQIESITSNSNILASLREFNSLLTANTTADHHREYLLRTGLVPSIIALLHREDVPDIQCEVAEILFLLTRDESTAKVVACDAIASITRLLTSSNESLLEPVVKTIGNIAVSHREQLFSAGAFPLLLKLLEVNYKEEEETASDLLSKAKERKKKENYWKRLADTMKETMPRRVRSSSLLCRVLQVIGTLFVGGSNPSTNFKQALPYLLRLLVMRSDDCEVLLLCLQLLSAQAKVSWEHRLVLSQEGIVYLLSMIIVQREGVFGIETRDSLREYVINILVEFSRSLNVVTVRLSIIDNPRILFYLGDILSSYDTNQGGNVSTVVNSCWTISNFCRSSQFVILQADLLFPLLRLTYSNCMEIRKAAITGILDLPWTLNGGILAWTLSVGGMLRERVISMACNEFQVEKRSSRSDALTTFLNLRALDYVFALDGESKDFNSIVIECLDYLIVTEKV